MKKSCQKSVNVINSFLDSWPIIIGLEQQDDLGGTMRKKKQKMK